MAEIIWQIITYTYIRLKTDSLMIYIDGKKVVSQRVVHNSLTPETWLN